MSKVMDREPFPSAGVRSGRRAFVRLALLGPLALPGVLEAQAPGPGRGGGFTHPEPIAFENRDGWQSLFAGPRSKWGGRTAVRRAEDDELIAEGTPQKPLPNPQTHLIWRGGMVKD